MRVIRSSRVQEYEAAGSAMIGLVSPGQGARELTLVHASLAPGMAIKPHSHDREEIVVLFCGRLRVRSGDTHAELSPGDLAVLRPDEVHAIESVGDDPAEMFLVGSAGARSFSPDGDELPDPPWLR